MGIRERKAFSLWLGVSNTMHQFYQSQQISLARRAIEPVTLAPTASVIDPTLGSHRIQQSQINVAYGRSQIPSPHILSIFMWMYPHLPTIFVAVTNARNADSSRGTKRPSEDVEAMTDLQQARYHDRQAMKYCFLCTRLSHLNCALFNGARSSSPKWRNTYSDGIPFQSTRTSALLSGTVLPARM